MPRILPSTANMPLKIIERVRKSVRSIIDLDPKHQSQGKQFSVALSV